MKKYISLLLGIITIMACQEKEVQEAIFKMEVKGYVEEKCYTLGEEQTVYLWSSKSWADNQMSTVEYRMDPTVLENYNLEKGTSLKLLPDSCYRMEETHFEVDDDAEFAKFKVKYWPEKIIASGGNYNVVEYALPLRIWVNGVPQEDRYGSVLVGFLINPAEFTLLAPEEVEILPLEFSKLYELPVIFETNYNNKEWITLNFEIDRDLVQEYNKKHGTEFLLLPDADKIVSWLEEEGELERDVNQDSVVFFVDFAKSSIGKGDNNKYLLPIRLSGISSTRCKIQNDVCYFAWWNSRIEQSVWKVSTTSSWEGSGASLNDDNLSSRWLWNYTRGENIATEPENITYILRDPRKNAVVEKIECYAATSYGSWKGAKDIAIQITNNGTDWETVQNVVAPQLSGDQMYKYEIELDKPVTCLGIRLSISSYYSDGISFYEIYMHGKLVDNPNPPVISGIPQYIWNVETSTVKEGNPSNLVDDDISTFWSWDYDLCKLPEDITFTVKDPGQTVLLKGVELYLRQEMWGNKGPIKADILVTKDGVEWSKVGVHNFQFDGNGNPVLTAQVFELPTPMSGVVGVRISITETNDGGVWFGEIKMQGELE